MIDVYVYNLHFELLSTKHRKVNNKGKHKTGHCFQHYLEYNNN